MNIPLKITFKELSGSPALEEVIGQCVARLEGRFPFLTSCKVVVEAPNARERRELEVRVEVRMPRHDVAASGTAPSGAAVAAVKEAFNSAERQLRSVVDTERTPPGHQRVTDMLDD